jgi:hypothetical protein
VKLWGDVGVVLVGVGDIWDGGVGWLEGICINREDYVGLINFMDLGCGDVGVVLVGVGDFLGG